ncbi:Nramp family divalent metal transporter [Gaoshiqia sediminis]|uniref:Nramp family divalent metal transporter n=1 Tax=Gaoshiqia sediminis TaxID=2986998 RepID=A0AA41Y7Q1_9BACT|nr:Nramp family divalent metal transporter [Gaoshiqia sediminis]MCW0484971.1 Nramp family divalent metal transporter [Gaoshiqia sediminis]
MKINSFIRQILPGIFLIGFNIGTGSVTAMTKSGADFGMAMLWALFLSCLFTFFLIHFFGKFTISSSLTFLNAIRKNIHPLVAIFFIIALGVNVSGSIIGVMGIAADVLQEWSKEWIVGGISSLIWASSITFLIIVLFLLGNTSTFKKALSIMVGIMGLSFIINAIIMFPSLKEIAEGLIPRIPESVDSSPFFVVAGMVGTTLAPIIFVVRSILVKDEGWSKSDLKIQRTDAFVSAGLMFLISAAIMASAAGTLHLKGITLIETKEMVHILKPLAGAAGVGVFVIGITAAAISSQFPNIFVVPWIISDYNGKKADMKSMSVRIIVVWMAILGIAVPLFQGNPIWVMVASQAFGAIVLPLTVGCMMYLANSKKLMGELKATTPQNLIFVVILIFATIMGGAGIYGLIN